MLWSDEFRIRSMSLKWAVFAPCLHVASQRATLMRVSEARLVTVIHFAHRA